MPAQAVAEQRIRARVPLNPYLLDVLRGFRATFASVFAFSFFINLLTLVVPLYLLQIYAKVLPSGNIDTLIFLTAMAFAAVVALGLLEAIRRALLAKAGARFERRVSEHLLDSAIHRAIVKSRPSVNALRDLGTVRGFVGGSGLLPLLDLPWSPLFILILFVLHPWLGVIGTVGACLLFALALVNERITREPLAEASRDSREMLDDARAYVRNADVIEAMGLQGELLSRWNERGADATVTSYRASRLNTRLASLSKLVRLFLQIGIIAVAAFLITRGELTAGATIACVLLLRRAIAPLEQSIRSWKSVLSAREALRTISEYLDHASTLAPGSARPTPDGTLVAHRLSFRPPGAERSLFSRVDLEILPGHMTALVGATAAGKSTLLRLLAGVVSPSGGRVTLGGHDLAHWHASQRGPHLGYLPQDVSLFPATVRENVARLTDAPIEAVIAAAERAGAHDMILALPKGYDTLVEEDGANLSGGQRQRIGFARALFGEPKVVLLDEPDANLDANGRSALRKSLRRLRDDGVALLAITHHASLEKTCDRVYRLDGGKVRLERDERRGAGGRDDAEGRTDVEGSADAGERVDVESDVESDVVASNDEHVFARREFALVGPLRAASPPTVLAAAPSERFGASPVDRSSSAAAGAARAIAADDADGGLPGPGGGGTNVRPLLRREIRGDASTSSGGVGIPPRDETPSSAESPSVEPSTESPFEPSGEARLDRKPDAPAEAETEPVADATVDEPRTTPASTPVSAPPDAERETVEVSVAPASPHDALRRRLERKRRRYRRGVSPEGDA